MKPGQHTPEIESFYHLGPGPLGTHACQGTACFVARHLDAARWQQATSGETRVYCLGQCYRAPSVTGEDARPEVHVRAPQAITLGRVASGGARAVTEATRQGAYAALEQALSSPPEALIAQVERSGLRGRGGAGFPTGRKLRAVAAAPGAEKVVVANADEGDAGAYIDRFLMEDDPHAVLEGLLLAAYAVGARRGVIYVRKEYPLAACVLHVALHEAHREGVLGPHILGSAFSCEVSIEVGRGSYLCGEETALLNALEGRRPFVRARPPYPAQAGLFGQPTLVQNVETLANLPWLARHGGEAYAALGIPGSRGTKVLSLNSLFHRPGLYEVELGTPVRTVVEELGGGLRTGPMKGVLIGGPLAGILPPHLLDTPLGFEELQAVGASVGHGGVVAFDANTSIAALVHHVFSFGAYESCGRCTPCRLGARHVERLFARVLDAGPAPRAGAADWEEVTEALRLTSLCGHGTGLGEFARSVLRHYREEVEACFG
ncbi:NADH-quinone oxidoreductase subunit D [Corallococcus exiguus]|uniref:complex I 51 kDa subunit family protein n=1 Tax=Corallococcus exiguus TaxID=83462 RepID=UPI001470F7CB|nr:NADH-ubiquinone oxidoreductase-F iron-sulfur binding region domain-containing protein [Corallococcus exiguus]NNB85315.1 NADH-quinone oxidoreductase subunit D [Corallococcus exiguus]NNC01571.1 NADH-quinone oxidoreductase subunit D [Corallococcus exiguus]